MDPSSHSLLPSGWVDILGAVDIGVMMAIGVVAFIMERSKKISETSALVVPLLLGAAYGLLEAVEKGWGLPAHIVKGGLLNGAGATIIARGVSITLRKWWDVGGQLPDVQRPDRNPLTPPAPLHGTRGNAVRTNGDDTMTTEIRNEEERR